MNHSCGPTCVFVAGGEEYTGVMVATRDLFPGEEITYDYCTSEDCELTPEWECVT
jgi:SET domain-containing protein